MIANVEPDLLTGRIPIDAHELVVKAQETMLTFRAGIGLNQVVVDSSGNTILQNPRPGTTGSTALNLPGVKGPGALGLDLALSKKVRITEKTTFTLRADALNFLNKPQWGLPNTNINSAMFGRITTATGSRTLLLNARVDF